MMVTERELLAQLVSADSDVRARAIAASGELSADASYVLRRLLISDDHVTVRALAARALGRCAAPAGVSEWLIDALEDRSPVVRDEAVRALARRRAVSGAPALADTAASDPSWWVRRAAVYAIGALGAL